MSTNPLIAALEAAREDLAELAGKTGGDATAALTSQEAERARLLVAALAHEAWACADRLRWYHEQGPGADPAQAERWRVIGDHFAQAGSHDPTAPPPS